MPITGFHSVDDGFKFDNNFVNPIINIPAIGLDIQTLGRCGGMAFLSLDYWFNKLPIPEIRNLPPDGTILADTIYARLIDSLFANGARFFEFMNMLDHPTWLRGKGAARVTREDEFPKIKASIDAGWPCPIGLVRARSIGELGNDHQVVCFGYESDSNMSKLWIYDNSHHDQVASLDFTTDYIPANRPVRHSITGEEWRGFFLEAYNNRRPWYMNEGTLVREVNNAPVHLIRGGASCWIPGPTEFDALGLAWAHVRDINQGSLSQIEQYAADGRVIKDRDNPAVYVVFGGKPFHIPSPEELEALGYHWDDLVVLPSGSVSRMRSTPRDRTLLRERSKGEVYEFSNGSLRHIVGPEVFDRLGYSWDNVRVVPDGALAIFPVGDPIR